jgi:hypothetical protein
MNSFKRRILAPFRRRRDAMTLQHAPYGLIRRLRNAGDLRQRLSPEALTNFGRASVRLRYLRERCF